MYGAIILSAGIGSEWDWVIIRCYTKLMMSQL